MSERPGEAPGPGLYVHVPFCRRICPYCDFAVTLGDRSAQTRFVDLLLREAEGSLSAGFDGPFDTLYLGGGTPSALSGDDVGRLIQGLRRRLPIAPDARLYLEANPEDVTPESLAAWRELGVSTLSLGLQALDDASLRLLGRGHDAVAGLRAVGAAAGAGFETLSLDLIYARPEQTPEAWSAELEQAAGLGAQHLSCYQLTFHEGTNFERRRQAGRLVPVPDDDQAELLRTTHEKLADLGYAGYEISNFAREPRHQSRHNRKYWTHVSYLGLGPSAHSFDGTRRLWNRRSLAEWAERIASEGEAVEGEETIGPEERALESLMLGLRTREGVDLGALSRGLGRDLRRLNAPHLERLAAEGLVVVEGEWVRPTLKGLAVADGLAAGLALS